MLSLLVVEDNFVTLSDLNSLTNINLSGNYNLKTANITNCNQQNVLKLYLNNTSISNFNNG